MYYTIPFSCIYIYIKLESVDMPVPLSILSSSRLNKKCYSCQLEDVFWEEWFSNYLLFFKTFSYGKNNNNDDNNKKARNKQTTTSTF